MEPQYGEFPCKEVRLDRKSGGNRPGSPERNANQVSHRGIHLPLNWIQLLSVILPPV